MDLQADVRRKARFTECDQKRADVPTQIRRSVKFDFDGVSRQANGGLGMWTGDNELIRKRQFVESGQDFRPNFEVKNMGENRNWRRAGNG